MRDSRLLRKSCAESMGTSVSATTSDTPMANEMVISSSLKSSAASPLMSRNGTTAARLVVVEAITAEATSPAPTCAASIGSGWSRWWRSMFSSMTMALSTSMPMPRARPPSDMMLSVRSATPISARVPRMAIGIAVPMMNVRRPERRNRKTITIARPPPIIAALPTPDTAECT